MAIELLQPLTGNPTATLFGGLGVSAAIILADFESFVSLDLPGKGQISLAGVIALSASTIYFLSKGGLDAIATELAGGIFGGIIIAAILSFYISNRS